MLLQSSILIFTWNLNKLMTFADNLNILIPASIQVHLLIPWPIYSITADNTIEADISPHILAAPSSTS